MRRGAVRKTSWIAGASSRSEVVKPGTSAFVESVRKRSTPSSPSRAKARRSVIRSSSGNWSILKSPVCSTSPAAVRIATARPSGIEWLTATNSQSNGPNRSRCPSVTSTGDRRDPVLLELRRDERQRQLRAHHGDVGALAQQVGHAADVVLVPVGQDDRLDLVQPVPDPGEVRQDHVDAGLGLLREQHAAVDDEQPPGVLEDRHVAADLTQAAEGHDAQRPLREAGGWAELGVGMAHRRSPVRVLTAAGRTARLVGPRLYGLTAEHRVRRGLTGVRALSCPWSASRRR